MSDYINSVDRIFVNEDLMMEKYLLNLTFSLNNSCIYEHMIKGCHEDLLNTGLPTLLNSQKYTEIILLYSYIHDVELQSPLKKAWTQYIFDKGISFLKNLTSDRKSIMEVVSKVIELKILTDFVLETCF